MTDESKPKIGNLELNRETVQDLTEQEGEQAAGGMAVPWATLRCYTVAFSCNPVTDCCLMQP